MGFIGGWAAWIFDYQGPPVLVTDNVRYQPTYPYGAAVQAQMRLTPPVPLPGAASVTAVNDNTLGTSLHAFAYAGSWYRSTGTPAKYLGDDHYSRTAGSTSTFRFRGTKVVLYASRAAHHGKLAVSLDGGAETLVDLYSATRRDGVPVWTSPVVAGGDHSIRLRVTGQRNAASQGYVVTVDRIDVTRS